VAKGRLTRGDRAAGDEWRRGRAGTRGTFCRRRQSGSRGAEGVQRKKKEGKGSRDPFAKFKSYRDPAVIKFFPLI
jgi:hypothetical protein